jgi:hypothetical protein
MWNNQHLAMLQAIPQVFHLHPPLQENVMTIINKGSLMIIFALCVWMHPRIASLIHVVIVALAMPVAKGYKEEINHCAPYVGNPLTPYTKYLTLEARGLTASSPH